VQINSEYIELSS